MSEQGRIIPALTRRKKQPGPKPRDELRKFPDHLDWSGETDKCREERLKHFENLGGNHVYR